MMAKFSTYSSSTMFTAKVKLFVWALIFVFAGCLAFYLFTPKSKLLKEPVEFSVSEGVWNKFRFKEIGLQQGDTISDLLLIDPQDQSQIQLKEVLDPKKHTVLISGSYSCDVTTSQLHSIDSMYHIYQHNYNFYLIHTLEAHPKTSQSPYAMETSPWEAARNIEGGIEAVQPLTMGERLTLSKSWIKDRRIQTPVLVDNAKNEAWKQMGQGPNTAIILSPEGVVTHKEDWFDPNDLGNALAP